MPEARPYINQLIWQLQDSCSGGCSGCYLKNYDGGVSLPDQLNMINEVCVQQSVFVNSMIISLSKQTNSDITPETLDSLFYFLTYRNSPPTHMPNTSFSVPDFRTLRFYAQALHMPVRKLLWRCDLQMSQQVEPGSGDHKCLRNISRQNGLFPVINMVAEPDSEIPSVDFSLYGVHLVLKKPPVGMPLPEENVVALSKYYSHFRHSDSRFQVSLDPCVRYSAQGSSAGIRSNRMHFWPNGRAACCAFDQTLINIPAPNSFQLEAETMTYPCMTTCAVGTYDWSRFYEQAN
jgi:hypothetical protein